MTDPAELYQAVAEETSRVLVGNDDAVELLTIALLTDGHVILEGVPGVAKTTIARLFASAIDLEYNRIQMMPDVLPADVTGTHVYRESTGEFQLQRGPIFANVVMVDEINRATPKTQSALLEAMQEGQVTIEGDTHQLPTPFIVVATQNPIEMEGTFELPKAQRDRFQFKLDIDIPDRDDERTILDRFERDPDLTAEDVESVVSVEDLYEATDAVRDVHVAESVREYLLDVVAGTRSNPQIAYGASPRATLAFLHASKARAAIRGRDYVIPDDVKALARPTLVHRLVLEADTELADVSPEHVVDDVLDGVEPPGSETEVEPARPASTDTTD
ncbi:AAA family ATPase [Halorussus aquaticus]|uniref:AAA family ATPase n=1 Tax=Halorussus aquaticus TaxID=2953748 RepID=A0ABD5Q0X0_9EURY|nr:MoxR family ATPase [Halorussus aquaticus]